MSSCDLSTYECSDVGLLLPFINEYTWSPGFRIFIYLLGLLWSFMGVSIIAGIFMNAIEKITSKDKVIKVVDEESETGFKEVRILVWNGTVANLTLMALGSSAPEILLSIIEVVSLVFRAGTLGPSTIVGSAAFNMFCITGVCIMAIPTPEVRKIATIKVFIVTAVFSVFAYLWLIVILMLITPDYVDLWEAVVTFFMFPLMVVIAYIMDRDFCGRKPEDVEGSRLSLAGRESTPKTAGAITADALLKGEHLANPGVMADQRLILEFVKKLKREHRCNEKDIASIATYLMDKETPKSRGWYRRNAISNLSGSTKLEPKLDSKTKELLDTMLMATEMGVPDTGDFIDSSEGGAKAIIEFAAPSVAVMEKDGRAKLQIIRHGNLHKRVLFKVETIDGTAERDSDYVAINQTLVFDSEKSTIDLDIEIIDDSVWEPDEVFFVRISAEPGQPCVTGKRAICQVVILNDDDPGTAEFEKPSYLFKESCEVARIPVSRVNGADGVLKIKWETKDISAVAGRDYENTSGELVFKHGEVEKEIEILIKDDSEFEKDENFEIVLTGISDGGKLGKHFRTVVTIVNDDEFNGFVSRVMNLTNTNLDALRVQTATYGQQFVEAMNVNGGDLETATPFDYVMHFFTFGWKLVFALVPPVTIWGGWLSFVVALAFTGILTAIIGDLAGIFGCLIGLESAVTAITFVALGTSLPDLFASKQAATEEKTADNAIGNVTGSNAVNVFLGLGLPWLLASIYWTAQGKTFEVPAGDLGFSVVLFTCCALLALALLMVRRYVPLFGGELGGPKVPKIACGVGLVILWIFYVLLSSMQVYSYIDGF